MLACKMYFTYFSTASACIRSRTGILTVKFCIVVEPLHREWTIAREINDDMNRRGVN